MNMLSPAVLTLLIAAATPAGAAPEPPRWEVADPRGLDGCPGAILFFDAGSATLSPQAKVLLDSLIWMHQMVDAGAWVEANGAVDHLEASGDPALALRRAEAARDYLVSRGLDPRHIRLQSWGSTRPLVEFTGSVLTDQQLMQNRFVNVAPVMPRQVFRRFFPPGAPIC